MHSYAVMNITEALQAFYEGKRSEFLPFVLNDLVTVKQRGKVDRLFQLSLFVHLNPK